MNPIMLAVGSVFFVILAFFLYLTNRDPSVYIAFAIFMGFLCLSCRDQEQSSTHLPLSHDDTDEKIESEK